MAMAAISSGGLVGRCGTRCAVETPLDVRIQGKGNFVKTPGADSVGATFVFLDLFETDADFVAQHGLTQTELSPARAYHLADMRINWIWLSFVVLRHERHPQFR